MKKVIKIGLKILGFLFLVICSIYIILFFIMFLFTSSFPSNNSTINEKICINFTPNRGSQQSIIVRSYYCNNEPDWNIVDGVFYSADIEDDVMQKMINDDDFRTVIENEHIEKVLDNHFSMECPSIKIKDNLIKVKQKKICKEFAHSSYPDKYTNVEIEVNEDTGKFNFIKGGSEF